MLAIGDFFFNAKGTAVKKKKNLAKSESSVCTQIFPESGYLKNIWQLLFLFLITWEIRTILKKKSEKGKKKSNVSVCILVYNCETLNDKHHTYMHMNHIDFIKLLL